MSHAHSSPPVMPHRAASGSRLGLTLGPCTVSMHLGLEDSRRVQWCAVGQQEKAKCDNWSAVSGGALACATEETPEDCIAAIMVGSP